MARPPILPISAAATPLEPLQIVPISQASAKNLILLKEGAIMPEIKSILKLLLRILLRFLENNDMAQRRADEARRRDDAGDDA